MADPSHAADTTKQEINSTSTDLAITQLREVAQQHLKVIEAENVTEAQAQSRTLADVQKYTKTKTKRKDRQRSKSPPQAGYCGATDDMAKGPRLRSAADVLDRLKWDPSVRIEEYIIGYLERFDGIMEMPASKWIRESTEEDFIPQHRIKWVKRRSEGLEEVVWDRELRVDKLFGSGAVADAAEIESVVDSVDGGVAV